VIDLPNEDCGRTTSNLSKGKRAGLTNNDEHVVDYFAKKLKKTKIIITMRALNSKEYEGW
jgi:hypothetical protein